MLKKIEQHLKFNPKRNFKLITPCCNRNNKDGKFTNYLHLTENYGYCHSCGKATLPPTLYQDETGKEYYWNESLNKFEPYTIAFAATNTDRLVTNIATPIIPQKFIPETEIWPPYFHKPENNLLEYLRKTYGNEKVDDVKELYAVGSTYDGGTIFWNINKELKVQKAKIAYYDTNGKRTDKFKVPYKNESGYYTCLFGEHLLTYQHHQTKTVILVESEKTAIVGSILLPDYVWLSFGGSTGLTLEKISVLKGFRVLIVPDMSENAIAIIYKKIAMLIAMGINTTIWDMTNGKTDSQLKIEGLYNNDLEDVFRKLL